MRALSITFVLGIVLMAASSDSAFAFGGRGGRHGGGYGGCGWGGCGYGGFGYGGYGLGYGRGYGGFGYGGYGYGGYGYGLGFGDYTPTPASEQLVASSNVIYQSRRLVSPVTNTDQFAALGESYFRAGRYQEAVRALRHALIDEPNSPRLTMLLAQALFQTGQWTQAADTTKLAMESLPESAWGEIVRTYSQHYGDIEDYTRQVRVLEAAAEKNPDDPTMRFLLGFHYGYLKYPHQAERELNKAIELDGDTPARQLLAVFTKSTAPLAETVSERSSR